MIINFTKELKQFKKFNRIQIQIKNNQIRTTSQFRKKINRDKKNNRIRQKISINN